MTDKQIKKYCDGLDCAICEEKEPCIYKIANELEEKLKAKEQECKALEKVAKPHLAETFEMQKEINLLKIENEVLKEKLETVYDDCKGCSTCNEALYNANLYAKEYRKLKQALQEIKEIAEVNKNYKFEITKGVCIGDTVELKLDVLEQILNKIKEVEK